jgi:hypothetical protein
MTRDLKALMDAASRATPDEREKLGEQIARYGDDAVRAMEPWLDEPELRPFAASTIRRAAELGARPIAEAVLRKAQRRVLAAAGASELGETAEAISDLRQREAPRPRVLTRLVKGWLYRRPELFAAGLGGNPQAGISYPAKGDHALLLPTPGGRQKFGYRDRWDGPEEFLYYGEWKGTPDMSLTGGNQVIIERSPKLYFFPGQGKGIYLFEGAFEYLTHTFEWTERDRNRQRAIVFRLRRVSHTVEL